MSDKAPAVIELFDVVGHEEELAELFAGWSLQDSAAPVRAAAMLEGVVLTDDEADLCVDSEICDALEALSVSYFLRQEAVYDYDGTATCFVPGLGRFANRATQTGEMYLTAGEIRELVATQQPSALPEALLVACGAPWLDVLAEKRRQARAARFSLDLTRLDEAVRRVFPGGEPFRLSDEPAVDIATLVAEARATGAIRDAKGLGVEVLALASEPVELFVRLARQMPEEPVGRAVYVTGEAVGLAHVLAGGGCSSGGSWRRRSAAGSSRRRTRSCRWHAGSTWRRSDETQGARGCRWGPIPGRSKGARWRSVVGRLVKYVVVAGMATVGVSQLVFFFGQGTAALVVNTVVGVAIGAAAVQLWNAPRDRERRLRLRRAARQCHIAAMEAELGLVPSPNLFDEDAVGLSRAGDPRRRDGGNRVGGVPAGRERS